MTNRFFRKAAPILCVSALALAAGCTSLSPEDRQMLSASQAASEAARNEAAQSRAAAERAAREAQAAAQAAREAADAAQASADRADRMFQGSMRK